MARKLYRDGDLYEAAKARLRAAFRSFERVCVALFAGKDSSVTRHLVLLSSCADPGAGLGTRRTRSSTKASGASWRRSLDSDSTIQAVFAAAVPPPAKSRRS
jgi:hypothetical protein